jgi:SARP family transcriptional regulator, regulator of embCAB operon
VLETGYQLLVRAHAAAGNTAEALKVYERCRALISEELGVPPSRRTQALHSELLASL